ncbi:MAG: gliding motility-associated C-terminal domain-containing protein [Bacteroidetes bacterium]|nr:gliding motility-associated C-terminal domain-containing protein [Bacteroidota bacterium]
MNIDLSSFEMFIFDRWGNQIYYTTDITKPWDGTINNVGSSDKIVMDVYVYKIKAKGIDSPFQEYIGRVSLIP